MRTSGDSVSLQRDEGGGWTYIRGGSDPPLPADQVRITGLASRLAGLKAQARVADPPAEAQRTEFGLLQPDTQISAGSATETLTLVVGAQNPRRTAYYTQLSGAAAVYLVDLPLVDDLKRLVTQPPDPPTPTPVPPTSTPSPATTTPNLDSTPVR